MKHFRFTLQALLTIRQREERKALESYALKLQQRQLALDSLNAAEDDLAHSWLELRQQMADGGPAVAYAQRQRHCERLTAARDARRTDLDRAEDAANLALVGVVTARQAREVVEKFQEQQRAAHQRECQREEQKLLDEMSHRADPHSALEFVSAEPVWN